MVLYIYIWKVVIYMGILMDFLGVNFWIMVTRLMRFRTWMHIQALKSWKNDPMGVAKLIVQQPNAINRPIHSGDFFRDGFLRRVHQMNQQS